MSHGSPFRKADWYLGWASPDPHKYSIFTEQNTKRHAEFRRNVQAFYSMSSLVSYESYVNQCGHLFLTRLKELSDTRTVIDMGLWLQFYAFDVISMITVRINRNSLTNSVTYLECSRPKAWVSSTPGRMLTT